jgi:rare lipoprotein A
MRGTFLMILLMVTMLAYDGYIYGSRHLSQPAVQQGTASWYGREEQGKPTADGETFDRHKLTAAHRHLPFNTIIRVTNRLNGRSVIVRINDRGPYRGGRILDLSEAAADTLDMKKTGVAPVDIVILPPADVAESAP